MNQEIVTKKCSKCQEVKPFSQFHKDKSKIDKYCTVCKSCKYLTGIEYRKNNNEQIKNKKKMYYENNKIKLAPVYKKYREDHKEYIKSYKKSYQILNKENIALKKKKYYEKNKNQMFLYYKNKIKTDLNFKLKSRLRIRLSNALKRSYGKKAHSTMELLGCTIAELKIHLEKQFTANMSWNNYGQFGWHIDHIIPCDVFDLTNPVEQKQCFHYSNLQPLWWEDNLKKKNKII